MDFSVWNLPGLSRFVAGVADDLIEGRNVFVFLPKHCPQGFYSALKERLGRDHPNTSGNVLEKIFAQSISKSSPVYDLYEAYNFKPETQKPNLKETIDIRSLCQCEDFQGRIIWLDGIEKTCEKTREWYDFFRRYAILCGNQDLIFRTVFVVPIQGQCLQDNLPTENLLAHHWLWGRVSSLDLQIYANQMVSAGQPWLLENYVLVNVISSLCGYDLIAAEALNSNWVSNDEYYYTALQGIIEDRGWSHDPAIKEMIKESDGIIEERIYQDTNKPSSFQIPYWSEGIFDMVDGRFVTSPIAEVSRENKEEINRRIWRAHVRCLLPIVDEYRLKILRYLQTRYRINTDTWNTNKQNILEIGAIKYHIESDSKLRKKIDKELHALIELLTKIRNDLAHLTPVSPTNRKKLGDAIKILF